MGDCPDNDDGNGADGNKPCEKRSKEAWAWAVKRYGYAGAFSAWYRNVDDSKSSNSDSGDVLPDYFLSFVEEDRDRNSNGDSNDHKDFDIDPSKALAVPLLPMIAVGEEVLLALGVTTGVATHANSKKNRRKNYLYEIRSYGVSSVQDISDWSVFQVEKYGISSDNGYRVTSQVEILNQRGDGRFYDYVIKHNNIPGRFEALLLEKFYVTVYAATHNGNLPNRQYSPKPW